MLTKAARDEIRARADAAKNGPWGRFDIAALLDDLDAQDAELARIGADKAYLFQANVANEWEERYECQERRIELMNAEIQRLTADNDRLTVIARADEWQARYWAEHDAVADREATIMAERATAAALRRALERHVEICGQSGTHRAAAVLLSAEAALKSGAGKALLDAHAEEIQKAAREWLHLDAARTMLIEERDALRQTLNHRTEQLHELQLAITDGRCDGGESQQEYLEAIESLRQRAEAAENRATLERPQGLRSGQCCDPMIDGEICALLLRVEAAEATVEAIKTEISGDANFGCIVELLFYGPLREKEAELRIAHGKIAELEGELAERALGGEGK